MPVDNPLRAPAPETAQPSLRRALAWSLASFAAMLATSIAACSGGGADPADPVATVAPAAPAGGSTTVAQTHG